MIQAAHTADRSKMLSLVRRFIHVSVEQLWELWTEKDQLEAWFGPEGFDVQIISMDMRPGGEIRYILKAVGLEQVSLVENAALPLSTECRLQITHFSKPHRLGFEMLIDSFPEISPYKVSTAVEISPTNDGASLQVTFDEMHSPEITARARYCHASQLSKLVAVLTCPPHRTESRAVRVR